MAGHGSTARQGQSKGMMESEEWRLLDSSQRAVRPWGSRAYPPDYKTTPMETASTVTLRTVTIRTVT